MTTNLCKLEEKPIITCTCGWSSQNAKSIAANLSLTKLKALGGAMRSMRRGKISKLGSSLWTINKSGLIHATLNLARSQIEAWQLGDWCSSIVASTCYISPPKKKLYACGAYYMMQKKRQPNMATPYKLPYVIITIA